MKKHLLCIFAALMPLLASAQVEIEGIWYILNEYNQEAQVTQNTDGSTKYSGDITIPATVTYEGNSYSVTRIEDWAFNECRELTTVTIAENSQLRSIGIAAFQECSALTAINIPESVTSIEAQAFNGCNSLTEINIPEGVTSIGYYTFYYCTSLTNIHIPASVTSIGDYALYRCSGLTQITVDEENAVYDSRGECNAIIETESNTLIAGCASTIIPESIDSIEGYAFCFCSGLTEINIPANVKNIGLHAFTACSGLTQITVDEGNTVYDSRGECNALIETKTNTLIVGCSSTTIPKSVTCIGGYAFYNCTGLTEINIPKSVTSIGEYAFFNCTGLTEINIPESVESIGESAFDHTPWNDNQTDGVIYAGNVLLAYKGEMPENTVIEVKEGTKSIAGEAFSGCTNLTSITIPASVESIGNYAFYGCSNLTEINLPESVKSIGDYAFYSCYNLATINIPANVKNIEYATFAYCNSLATIAIPENSQLTSIGEYAFYQCSDLTKINIPVSVISIGQYAFYQCSNLATVSIVENSQLKNIGQNAFSNCSSLTEINIPESVESIEYATFAYCTSLATVNIPENSQLKNIEGGAFFYCSSLTTITLPEGLTDIRFQAFHNCSSLTTITLPESVANIETKAFANCPELRNVYCYAKSVPVAASNVFEGSNPENATLHVPASALNSYKNNYPWYNFGNFVGIQLEQCATPSISYVDGKFSLTSDTEGAIVVTHATIANEDTYKGLEFEFTTPMLTFTAIATKARYDDSDEVSLTICWIPCTEDHKEEEENEDNSINIPSKPVLISTQGGTITLSGLAEGTAVAAYSIAGAQLATATATNGTATLATNLPTGSIAIVKIGDYSIRVAIK